MKKTPKNKLSNPAAAVANAEVVKATASVIPFLVKTGLLVGLGIWGYRKITNRFVPASEVSYYPAANITKSQAKTKADSIHSAMKGFGNGFHIVAANINGLNYNGWIRLYNAFGNRETANPLESKMNITEWFGDQFDDEELAQLRFLVPNVF